MFVAIAHFPEISAERRAGLEAWFAWSNDELREVDGLTGRRLLRASDGTYVAVVEHESAQTFAAMSATGVAAHVQSRLRRILKGSPPGPQRMRSSSTWRPPDPAAVARATTMVGVPIRGPHWRW